LRYVLYRPSEPDVPTSLPSVATFANPAASAPDDAAASQTQVAAYWLRRDIVRGVFEPLERLKIEQLTGFYDIGVTPMREAILMLSGSGLVVHEHQKGHRVAPVSLADYEDTMDVYKRVYKLALEMAVEAGDDAWEERVVVQLHRSMKVRKVLRDGDPEARELWQRAYWGFHLQLLSGCGSPLLMGIYRDLGHRLERYVNLFAELELDRARDHHAEFREIVDAVMGRDATAARRRIDAYFGTGEPLRRTIRETLRAREARPARGRGRSSAAAGKMPAVA